MSNVIKLSNGIEIPHIGLGTYPMRGQTLTDAVIAAYENGYRLIDTADNYYNESDLGDSLSILYKHTQAKRDELFLVSKVSDELYHPQAVGGGLNKGIYFWKNSSIMKRPNAVHDIVTMKVDRTLENLHTDYLDLYLMHWPYPDFLVEIWEELERLYKSGKVRAIGMCNCQERHFEKLKKNCEIFPMVNQMETSPLNTKEGIIDYCNQNNIRVMVYSPLMSLKRREKTCYMSKLQELAKKYNITTAQVVLRYNIQRGLIPIPKSSDPNRLKINYDVFNFAFTVSEMDGLSSFNENLQSIPESKACPGL